MQLSNYRSSVEHREILRILQKSTTLEENILWQSNALGKTVVPVHHFEIDFVSREVVIYYDAHLHRVDSNLTLYVKLDYRTSVFKVNDFRFGQNSIHFPFPAEIKTQELRTLPRVHFRPQQDKYVTLKASTTSTLSKDSGASLTVRALDISEYGLGLMISENNRSFIKNNRILWVTSLQGESLQYPILAEVMYINTEIDPKFQITKKQKDLKVGLKLSGIIPEDIYKRFSK